MHKHTTSIIERETEDTEDRKCAGQIMDWRLEDGRSATLLTSEPSLSPGSPSEVRLQVPLHSEARQGVFRAASVREQPSQRDLSAPNLPLLLSAMLRRVSPGDLKADVF